MLALLVCAVPLGAVLHITGEVASIVFNELDDGTGTPMEMVASNKWLNVSGTVVADDLVVMDGASFRGLVGRLEALEQQMADVLAHGGLSLPPPPTPPTPPTPPPAPPPHPPPVAITHYPRAENGAWDGSWSSAQSFCHNKGHQDLCRYSTLCPNGRQNSPVNGRLAQDEWTPVRGDVGATHATNFVQVGTRSSPRDDCCLLGDVCHGYHGPNFWGASRHSYMDELYCCDHEP